MMKRTFAALILFIFMLASASIAGAQQRAPYIDGEVIVKYKNSVPDADRPAYIKKAGGISSRSLGPIRAHRVRLEKGLSVESAIARFKADTNVQYAEPNYRIHSTATTPNDTNFAIQWGLNNTGQTVSLITGVADADIDAPEAWDVRTDASGIIVAAIDSGVQYLHPDLTPNIWTNTLEIDGNLTDDDGNGYIDDTWGWDFANNDNIPEDDFGHGTHVAGVIGAAGNNGAGVSGVAWNVKLMSLKVMDSTGSGAVSDTIEAIYYAVSKGARIINASYSYPDGCYATPYSQAERDAIEYAGQMGVLFVAAASNYACNNDSAPAYPASYDLDNVVSVAATDLSDGLAWFSDYGPGTVHVGAPGVEILSTYSGSSYAYESGTSASAPFACGVLSLIEANNGGLSYKQARELLLLSADPLSSLSGYTITGGRINAYNALMLNLSASAPAPPSHLTIDTGTVTLSWVDNSTVETSYTVEIKDPLTGSYTALATIGADSTSSVVSVPIIQYEGYAYYFRVKASNTYGDSAYSTEVSTNAPPTAPSTLTAVSLSDSKIAVGWLDLSQIEDGYIVEMSTDGASFVVVATLGANSVYTEITGLAASTTYYFRVAAYSNTYGTSGYSDTASATTLALDTGIDIGGGDGGSSSGGDGSGGGGSSGGCFIATAAYGNANAPDVETLRVFRDRVLLANHAGREFVRLYYEYSPSIAARIEGHPALMFGVRMALKPLVLSVRYPMPALALVLCAPAGLALIRRRKGRPDRSKGFTLLELIVVVFILSILAAIVAPKFMGRTDDAKVAEAKVQIRNLETALKLYRIDTGVYPSTEQGLDALVTKPSTGVIPSKYREGGYLEQVRVPADPWGNPYIYASPGTSGDFDIISLGADAKEGGEGLYDKDIKSWDMN